MKSSHSQWAETLIAQHTELNRELLAIERALNEYTSIQLDVHLKKFTVALLTHLKLEEYFLVPALKNTRVSSAEIKKLTDGFEFLLDICSSIRENLHSQKLEFGNRLINKDQIKEIQHFFHNIKIRINDESILYTRLKNN